MEDYTKATLTYDQQLALLQRRGLSVDSPDEAVKFLQRVNYYRFSAYCLPFQNTRDKFIAGTMFARIIELYSLDEELRNALMTVLSPIEVFLRTRVVYELSHGWGTFACYEPSLFRDKDMHTKWVESLDKQVEQSNERFLEHYRLKYNGFPRLPLWIACEVMSMGTLSLLYSNLLPEPQRRICSILECHRSVLANWMHVITYLRNICAHHGRLWNRELQIRPLIPRDRLWTELGLDNTRLFAGVAMMEWICRRTQSDLNNFNPVYEVIRKISAMQTPFSVKMGVPVDRSIGMCWDVKE